MFASISESRRLISQLKEKSGDDLLKLKKKRPEWKELIDEILKERIK